MEKKFNVLVWNFNSDSLEYYDVMPYLRNSYKERKERYKVAVKRKDFDPNNEYYKVPETLEDFKNFVKNESLYQFWSRCEYEMICHGWPVKKNTHKLDVHEQIMMNIDVIAEILYKEMHKLSEKQGEQKSIDDLTQQEAMDIAVAKCFEQGEQKPAWSEEDEEFLRRAIKAAKTVYPMTANWLKSIKNRITNEN